MYDQAEMRGMIRIINSGLHYNLEIYSLEIGRRSSEENAILMGRQIQSFIHNVVWNLFPME